MEQRKELAQQFLREVLEQQKREEKITGFAIVWVGRIIEISYLNGFEELMEEALALRTSNEKIENPFAGAITNMETSKANMQYQWPQDKQELEKKYSYDNVREFLKIGENSEEASLFIKSPREMEAAIKIAKDDYELETIACCLCVHGYFEEAQKMIEHELSEFSFRIYTVKMVMCIELFRRGEFDTAKKIVDEIYPSKTNSWTNLQFAYGILGYQPWGGYPFSDY